jgi:type IV secretion system protein VirD4
MSTVLGSAQWSTDHGNWRYTPIGNAGSPFQGRFLLLGESPNVHGHLHVRPPVQHLISIAPTRSGKGVSLIVPNLLVYGGSVLVVDPKGENAWITAAHRRDALGQKTVIVDPWGEVNRRYGSMAGESETIARFNPLSILDPGSDEYVDDLAYLADAVIISQSSRDPHWDDSARELVAGLIAFVVESPQYRDSASLGLVRALLSLPGPQLRVAIRDAQNLEPGSIARAKLARFEAETNEIDSVMSTARTQTGFLDSEVLTRNMETSDFSFEELCGGNISVYLVLPPDKLETYARWLRLMVSIAIRAVSRGCATRSLSVSLPSQVLGQPGARGLGGSKSLDIQRPQNSVGLPVLFILDEFGTIGKLNAVAQAYGLMAGLGMIMWAFAQDLNQLKRDYPDHWETFIGNSQAMTCFGVMDNFTADYISKMLGTATVQQVNVSKTEGVSVAPLTDNAPWRVSQRTSVQTSTSYSTQTMSRALLNPDEVRGLSGDHCLIMGRHPPILGRRIVYYEDWDMLHCVRPDPRFPRTEQVRWRALQRRLYEMGSVQRLLKEYRYEVKALKGGRWEVTAEPGTAKPARSFGSDNELWHWTYILAMDGVDQA